MEEDKCSCSCHFKVFVEKQDAKQLSKPGVGEGMGVGIGGGGTSLTQGGVLGNRKEHRKQLSHQLCCFQIRATEALLEKEGRAQVCCWMAECILFGGPLLALWDVDWCGFGLLVLSACCLALTMARCTLPGDSLQPARK